MFLLRAAQGQQHPNSHLSKMAMSRTWLLLALMFLIPVQVLDVFAKLGGSDLASVEPGTEEHQLEGQCASITFAQDPDQKILTNPDQMTIAMTILPVSSPLF